MKLKISILTDLETSELKHKELKAFLEAKKSDPHLKFEFEDDPLKKGEMGFNISNLFSVLDLGKSSIEGLFSLLGEYVKLFNYEIEVKSGDKSIRIKGNNLDKLEAKAKELLEAIN